MDLNSASSIASIVGLIVGGVGLAFSAMAWRRASAAEKAAKDAREAVRTGNAAEDLQTLREKASEFLSCVQQNQIEAACLRGRDLVSGINQAKERWQGYFPSPDIAKALGEAGDKVEEVSRALTIRRADLTPTERNKVLRFCN